ncbi:MAG: hypothetical protein GXP16_11320 [Gammaproteobacteria bacterium]|nr:hypothetical protein [Gammaproteobacteria bacterium]
MKVLYWVIGIVLGVPALLVIVMYGASELGGEVVTLDRAEENGDVSQVRVWIVDKNGLSWIEHGEAESHWIVQLLDSPNIVLTREGRTINYIGTSDPDSHDLYHQLRRQKYSWADQVVGLFGGGSAKCSGVPVRLQSID